MGRTGSTGSTARPVRVRGVQLLLAFLLAASCTEPIARAARGTGVRLVSGRELPSGEALAVELVHELRQAGGGRIHLFVRMRGQLTLDDHRALEEAGALLLDYLGQDTYVVSLPLPVDVEEAPYASVVEWAEKLLPADKLHPDLLGMEGKEPIKAVVVFFDDAGSTVAEDALRAAELEWSLAGDPHARRVETNLERLRSLAREESVSIIVPAPPPPRPSNDTARSLARTDQVQLASIAATSSTASIGFGGPTGEGIRIGICDIGFNEDHPDFEDLDGSSPCADSSGRRIYHARMASDPHGTHVASIAAGNGQLSAQYVSTTYGPFTAFALRGHAPSACLGDYSTFAGDLAKNFLALVFDGTDVTNHSYDLDGLPEYTISANQVDRVVRGGKLFSSWIPLSVPSRPQVWAAGNCGTDLTCPAVGYYAVKVAAKNAICVGSVDTVDKTLSSFSSLGPTFDGRIKPDLVAPGARTSKGNQKRGILAANTAQMYDGRGGTSQAAPVVTGTIALMMEALEDEGVAQRSLRASTFKAILIHTAEDLSAPLGVGIVNPDTEPFPVTYGPGPDFATGYGLVNAQDACTTIGDSWRWIEGWISASGEERDFCFDVQTGATEVKVTLAWDDLPGSLFLCDTCPALVSDLDLTLIDPNGRVIFPWIVDAPPLNPLQPSSSTLPVHDPIGANVPSATRGVDRRNNVEMASLTDPQPGHWRARVRAYYLPFAKSQPFSLVTSHDMGLCWPRFPPMSEICRLFEGLCDFPRPTIPHFDPERRWTWEDHSLLPLSELRKVAGQPPLHDDRAWIGGPGFEVVVWPLARGVGLALVDESGTIVARGLAEDGVGRVRVEGTPANERLCLLLADADWQPFTGSAGLEIGVEMLD